MKPQAFTAVLLAAGLGLAAPALAQPGQDPGVTASQPMPDTAQASPGIPGPEAVNPAPGATGPFVGAGRRNFYDIDQRIAAVGQAVASLPAAQRRRAMAQFHTIKAEEATQRARHGGELRDWDRENLSVKLDKLVQAFPSLSADAGPPAPPPGQ